MKGFWLCLLYYAAIGVISQLIGPALPREWFHEDKFPYRPYRWEKGGKIYQKIGIQYWKDLVPDMSKIDKHMVRKSLQAQADSAHIYRLLQETCVAELVHWILMLLGLWSCRLWHTGGFILWIFYALLGHVPFILIQRYNRPRLRRLYGTLQKREMRKKACES